MLNTLQRAAALVLSVAATTALARTIDESKFAPGDIIVKDVVIVGGGAAGSYAAVRIKDSGKSVVVIEASSKLGGHVNTYTDPKTGAPIDFGVRAYMDLPGVKDFFNRFSVPTAPAAQLPLVNKYVDFTTGSPVPNWPAYTQEEQNVAIGTYAQITAQFIPLIFPGYENFPTPPPEDLLMSFRAFLAKYNLNAALPFLYTFVAFTDWLDQPALNAIQNLGGIHLNSLFAGGFFTPASHNNSQLYAAVASSLGADVIYGSKASVSDRTAEGVSVVVKGAGNKLTLVKAKRLLVAVPPTRTNMYPLDQDEAEKALWAKWIIRRNQIGIFSGSNIPDGTIVVNTGVGADAPAQKLPYVHALEFTGVPGLFMTTVISEEEGTSEHAAKQLVRDAVKALGDKGVFSTKRIDFAAFEDHGVIQLRPSAEDLKAGFYQTMVGMQGKRNTWYVGSAWTSDYTSIVWTHVETVLPRLLAGL